MNPGDYARLSTDELIQRFIDGAEVTGNVFGLNFKTDPDKLVQSIFALRARMSDTRVVEMQALGAELRKRSPVAELRKLFAHQNRDVRGWASTQFISVDPDWATATLTGLQYDLSTREVMQWRDRILRGAPKRPRLGEMAIPQLVNRFVDACERCYGSTRFLTDEQGGGSNMEAHNRVSGDIYNVAKELNRRGELHALVPLLGHPLITVRQRAARYCLPVATARAIATLEQVVATKTSPESWSASRTLDFWRKGEYCAFPNDLRQVRV